MKKAGILTFHNAENFGAALQTYALQKTLEKMGLDCKIIDYRNKGVAARNFLKNCYYLATLQNPAGNIRRYKLFRDRYFNLTARAYHSVNSFEKDANDYDYLFFGSDQIWNPDLSNGLDKMYWGMFRSRARKIAYSASLGKDLIPESEIDTIKQGMKRFDAVSVREKNVPDVLGLKIDCVLDPCFLLSESEWEEIAPPQDCREGYILVYQLHTNKKVLENALSLSNKVNKKIKLISPIIAYDTRKIEKTRSVSPQSFLRYFMDANYIITDSFHGTAFSILFHKSFHVVLPPQKRGRIYTLLNSLDLKSRIIDENSAFDNKIDFKKVDPLLENEIAHSINFIKKNLK